MSTGCCPYTVNDPERVDPPFGFKPFGWDEFWYRKTTFDFFTEETTYFIEVAAADRFLVKTTTFEGAGANSFGQITTGTLVRTETMDPETGETELEWSGSVVSTHTLDPVDYGTGPPGEQDFTRTADGTDAPYSENIDQYPFHVFPGIFIDTNDTTELTNLAPWHVRFLPPSHCYLKLFWDDPETTWEWEPPSEHGLCIPEDFDFDDPSTWPRTPDFTDEHEGEMKYSFSPNYTPTGIDPDGLPLP